MLPEAAGRGQHFQARGHRFSLYGPTLSRTITCLSFFLAVNWLSSEFVYATLLLNLVFRVVYKPFPKTKKQRANERVFTRQRKMYERTDLFRTT